MRTVLIVTVSAFLVLCAVLIAETGLFENGPMSGRLLLLQQSVTDANTPAETLAAPVDQRLVPNTFRDYGAAGGPAETVMIGAEDPCTVDPDTGFEFQLELSTLGAAIRKATFSDGKKHGFNNRDPKHPKPLVLFSPLDDVMSLANGELILVQQNRQFNLDELSWKNVGIEKNPDGSETARFSATITDPQDRAIIAVTKSYKVMPVSNLVECDITVDNLSDIAQKVSFNLNGPLGIEKEEGSELRKIVAAFRNDKGEISSQRLDISKFDGSRTFEQKPLSNKADHFLWASVTNKYFAAIIVPVPDKSMAYCDWIVNQFGCFYNPDGRKATEDENIGVGLRVATKELAPSGREGSARTYAFRLYLGPKDKSFFDKNDYYRQLGFVQTIDFMSCCCPESIIRPLAFAILAIMKWMYAFIPNYGVVIIILVFVMRLVIHPLTKKSQVSMSKMGKLAPKMEEIKKKYAGNKTELNRQMMALYRKQGASPVMGMLPMFAQMPIWIALWSAVYTSIELRGASFLPFWITDLSAPDALFKFPAVMLPLFGKLDSFNLLPLLMGVAFYLQQKLMPAQAAASTNPQVAQQQKMMMIMMPLIFPLAMYNSPSGVNLYIMASTFAGVIEQYVIRKHIEQREQAEAQGLVPATAKTGGKVRKKRPRPFFRKF
jgi:YidC/Oxa1 family membrane protein insertase